MWGKAIDENAGLSMEKIMILPICLGIFLLGIVIIPNTFADGCGPGTVLVDGVCELASIQESSTGCGPGTVLVDGVCVLDEKDESTSTSNEPLYVIIAVVAIGGVIGAVFAIRRGSKTAKPTEQESKRTKTSTEMKEASEFCQSCGTVLKPAARYCGKCGSPHS